MTRLGWFYTPLLSPRLLDLSRGSPLPLRADTIGLVVDRLVGDAAAVDGSDEAVISGIGSCLAWTYSTTAPNTRPDPMTNRGLSGTPRNITENDADRTVATVVANVLTTELV